MTKRNGAVNADTSRLPDRWWLDEMFLEDVHTRVRGLLREGVSQLEVARRVGCSSRTVIRIAQRSDLLASAVCGAPTWSPRKGSASCGQSVVPGTRCRYHA